MNINDGQEKTCKGSIMLGGGCGVCSKCKKEIEQMRDKLQIKQVKSEPQLPQGMPGWICPKCGRGNAPFSSSCPCVPMPAPIITC